MRSTPSQNCFSKLHIIIMEYGFAKVIETLPRFMTHKNPSEEYQKARKHLEAAAELYEKDRTNYSVESTKEI